MILLAKSQEHKWQSKCDFAEPFPLTAIRGFEGVI